MSGCNGNTPLPPDGIFYPRGQQVFQTLESYLIWNGMHCPSPTKGWVGLLINRKNLEEENLAVERCLIEALETQGHGVIPVFTAGSREENVPFKDFSQLVECYYSGSQGLLIEALINSQIFLAADKGSAENILEQGAALLEILDIPVFRPVISYLKTPEKWLEEKEGLHLEIPWAFTAAEMQGMIEPHFIGGRTAEGVMVPVPERIHRLAQRVSRWVALRYKGPEEKKAVIMLHNAPCHGVEATVGMASGMDAMDGAVTLLKSMRDRGWTVENVPDTGAQLRKMIEERRAWSDFRWTSAADINGSGGVLHHMGMEGEQGYRRLFDGLDDVLKEQMTAAWGAPPGEGMVLNGALLITGISFGNVVVMVQPKRGCHSAKCTGEVCLILQDPECPPPHQYLAAYRYIETHFGADAVIHFGTHGSLEFLPGKSNVLSHLCWPEVVLGTLPNLYVYNAGVATEGTVAKRRSKAVIVDHLPSVYMGVDAQGLQLSQLISEYQEALQSSAEQAAVLEKQIREAISHVAGAQSILESAESFNSGIRQIKGFLLMTLQQPRSERPHRFGCAPELEEAAWYIAEVVTGDPAVFKRLTEMDPDPVLRHRHLFAFISGVVGQAEAGRDVAKAMGLSKPSEEEAVFWDSLAAEVRFLWEGLQETKKELENLHKGLNGGFIPPGPSGMPDENGRNILPTGRNLFLLNVEKVPTRAAYLVGVEMAERMLALFLKEEGRYPENVAINMLSLDISRAKGEQLSQVLHLLGIRPVWSQSGRVEGLEVLNLKVLGRPRIDVTVRITGVLRDTYPHIYEMLDEAVLLAAGQEEPEELNYVRKQTRLISEALQKSGNEDHVARRATLRVFGDRPGTYGAGVDLALKASAWEKDEDLARTFVYFSAFAYGKDLHGSPASQEFVGSARNTEVTYDSSDSKRYDLLDSSFGASVQGGFRLLRKAIGEAEPKQYHGNRENKQDLRVKPLKEELQQITAHTLLNPFWKENMKSRGYEGASKLMQRLQNVFEWQCTTEEFGAEVLDKLVEAYVNDPEMQRWFIAHNAYALEETARRFLELHRRGRWKGDPEVLNKLQISYLSIEGEMEDRINDNGGDIQAGQIEIVRDTDLAHWRDKTKDADDALAWARKS